MTADLDVHLLMIDVDGDSFDLFYASQRKPLIALAYAVTGNRSNAEDLAQEALTAAYRSWDDIKVKHNPGTWVRRILLNKASSAYRRRMAEASALARRPRDAESVSLPEVTGEIDMIWREVRRLPRRQLEVIVLAYVEGMSMSEIAQVLEVTKQTVNVHMGRARQTLADRLGLETSDDDS
ncbi:MAG: sigma-70 family RNA polymerase sigma factor [Acidimicrobiia bacterium]